MKNLFWKPEISQLSGSGPESLNGLDTKKIPLYSLILTNAADNSPADTGRRMRMHTLRPYTGEVENCPSLIISNQGPFVFELLE